MDSELPQETIRDAVNGSKAAIQEVLEAYDDELRDLIGGILGSRFPSDVDDACQEARIAITRAIPRFESRGSFRGFIRQTARFRARQYVRDKFREMRAVSFVSIVDSKGRSTPDPEVDNSAADPAMRMDQYALFKELYESLPARDRMLTTIYLSHKQENDAIIDIARQLCVQERQAKKLLGDLIDKAKRFGRRKAYPVILPKGDQDRSSKNE